MNWNEVVKFEIQDVGEVVNLYDSDGSIIYTYPIDQIPVNPDFEIIGAGFKSEKVYVGKVATITASVLKNFEPSGAILVDDQNTIRKSFQRYVVNTKNSDRDIITIIFEAFDTDKGNRTFTLWILDKNGNRSANSYSLTLEVI